MSIMPEFPCNYSFMRLVGEKKINTVGIYIEKKVDADEAVFENNVMTTGELTTQMYWE